MKQFAYLPVLKWKKGEYSALQSLTADVKGQVTPLVEITPVPWDYTNDTPTKQLDTHLAEAASQISTAWGRDDEIFVDVQLINGAERLPGGQPPLSWLFDRLREKGVMAIPTTGLESEATHLGALAEIAARDGRGICLRLDDEAAFSRTAEADINNLLRTVGVAPRHADLVLDLGFVSENDAARTIVATLGVLASLPHINEWRSLTLVSGAFPQNMSGLGQGVHHLDRTDYAIWDAVVARVAGTARIPNFGDYAVNHPELSEVDPRTMQMSANLRYTSDDDWIVLRGRGVRRYGFDQYVDLCRTLLARADYRGPGFSAGDQSYYDCAHERTGPGNATTWRRDATNHHITFVVRQLSTRTGP